MTSRETLECRIYMAEDSMYRQCDELDRGLHDLESMLKDLTAAVHGELCGGGHTPLEERAATIAQAVEAFEVAVDLGAIRARAEEVASAKRLVDGYQRELGLDLELREEGSPERHALDVLAAVG